MTTMAQTREQPVEKTGFGSLLKFLDRTVLMRSLIVTAILAPALTITNQYDALFGPARLQLLPLAIALVTPFVVVTLSQLLATDRAWKDLRIQPSGGSPETFIQTIFGHGIPMRAFVVASLVGMINTTLILARLYLDTGQFSGAPVANIAQTFVLPLAFGLLSQALAYRRAIWESPVRRPGEWARV
jgi:hypothetical protein